MHPDPNCRKETRRRRSTPFARGDRAAAPPHADLYDDVTERIVAELEAAGQEVPRDAFGHVKLDKINPGQYFGEQFSGMIEAEKTQVWKSGYFARSGASNEADLELIKACTDLAVDAALRGESGVTGQDVEQDDELRVIEFPRIKGARPFDIDAPDFTALLATIGQPKGAKVTTSH